MVGCERIDDRHRDQCTHLHRGAGNRLRTYGRLDVFTVGNRLDGRSFRCGLLVGSTLLRERDLQPVRFHGKSTRFESEDAGYGIVFPGFGSWTKCSRAGDGDYFARGDGDAG